MKPLENISCWNSVLKGHICFFFVPKYNILELHVTQHYNIFDSFVSVYGKKQKQFQFTQPRQNWSRSQQHLPNINISCIMTHCTFYPSNTEQCSLPLHTVLYSGPVYWQSNATSCNKIHCQIKSGIHCFEFRVQRPTPLHLTKLDCTVVKVNVKKAMIM